MKYTKKSATCWSRSKNIRRVMMTGSPIYAWPCTVLDRHNDSFIYYLVVNNYMDESITGPKYELFETEPDIFRKVPKGPEGPRPSMALTVYKFM